MLSSDPPAPSEPRTGVQLEDALRIAERFLDQAERTSDRRRVVRSTEAGVVGLAIFVTTSIAALDRFTGVGRLTFVWVIGILLGVAVTVFIYFVQEIPLQKRVARDAKAAVDIVEIVRELLPIVSRHEGWSELQTEMVRSRLSRFPIGPGGIDA